MAVATNNVAEKSNLTMITHGVGWAMLLWIVGVQILAQVLTGVVVINIIRTSVGLSTSLGLTSLITILALPIIIGLIGSVIGANWLHKTAHQIVYRAFIITCILLAIYITIDTFVKFQTIQTLPTIINNR